MQPVHRVPRLALLIVAAIVLASCAPQKAPAKKLIAQIEATITAASEEAAKYVPDQLMEVQTELGSLEASFDKHDYAAVVTGAPAVLDSAEKLATAAAVKKDEILKAQSDQWAQYAAVLPGDFLALQSRIDLLGKPSQAKLKAGIDVEAAKAGLSDAASLWSKAEAAFATGNMDEAVATAKNVQAKIDVVAASLKLDLAPPAPAAAAAT
jgi:hypothetical protein